MYFMARILSKSLLEASLEVSTYWKKQQMNPVKTNKVSKHWSNLEDEASFARWNLSAQGNISNLIRFKIKKIDYLWNLLR